MNTAQNCLRNRSRFPRSNRGNGWLQTTFSSVIVRPPPSRRTCAWTLLFPSFWFCLRPVVVAHNEHSRGRSDSRIPDRLFRDPGFVSPFNTDSSRSCSAAVRRLFSLPLLLHLAGAKGIGAYSGPPWADTSRREVWLAAVTGRRHQAHSKRRPLPTRGRRTPIPHGAIHCLCRVLCSLHCVAV